MDRLLKSKEVKDAKVIGRRKMMGRLLVAIFMALALFAALPASQANSLLYPELQEIQKRAW